MRKQRDGETVFENEIEELKAKDPVLAEVIDRVGPCTLELEPDPFWALAEAILYQQLSMKAAGTIAGRFKALYENSPPGPKDVLDTPDEKIREVGVSRPKVRYLKDLSRKFSEDIVTPSELPDMPDEEVIEQLTQIKGVGRWTAEMFLIFSLGRPDVLPVDDLGLQKAVQKCYGLKNLPSEVKIRKLAKKWEPYRTAATWYLWRSLAATPLSQ